MFPKQKTTESITDNPQSVGAAHLRASKVCPEHATRPAQGSRDGMRAPVGVRTACGPSLVRRPPRRNETRRTRPPLLVRVHGFDAAPLCSWTFAGVSLLIFVLVRAAWMNGRWPRLGRPRLVLFPRGDVRVPSPAPSQPFENEYQAFGGPVPPPKSPPCLSSPGQALIMSFLMPQRIAKCHQRPRRLNSTPPALVGACPPATDSENPPPAESHFACGTVTRRIETDSRCRATTNCRHAALRCPVRRSALPLAQRKKIHPGPAPPSRPPSRPLLARGQPPWKPPSIPQNDSTASPVSSLNGCIPRVVGVRGGFGWEARSHTRQGRLHSHAWGPLQTAQHDCSPATNGELPLSGCGLAGRGSSTAARECARRPRGTRMNAPTELQLRACRVCHCAFCPSSDTDRSLNDAIWQNARGGCARAVDATECALCPSLARSILHTKHPCALANGTLVLTYRIDGDIRRALFPGSIGPRDVTWDLIGSMMQNKTNGDAQRPLLGIGTLMQGGGRRWRDIDLLTLPRSWFPSSRGSQARKATRNLSKSLSHSRPNPPRVYTTSELDRYTQRRRSSIAERGETVNMAGRNPRRYLAPAAATFRVN
ncbi:hypothetical protein PCL_03763 [Purpureocillium lilacinum]|uniref:Uncharacterized protein n=1 Tax=Purpureocillium lilacinum TaxID=33203 RepID=A0A2U3EPZ9_PURLI|nr:hypothetical protein PCL_03763 [Purpureocillium lilacinum]